MYEELRLFSVEQHETITLVNLQGGCGHGLLKILSQLSPDGNHGQPVRIISAPAKIATIHLLNGSQKWYRFNQLGQYGQQHFYLNIPCHLLFYNYQYTSISLNIPINSTVQVLEYIDEGAVKQMVRNTQVLTDEARLKATTGLKIDSTGIKCEVVYPAQVTDFDKIPLQVSILWHTLAVAVTTCLISIKFFTVLWDTINL